MNPTTNTLLLYYSAQLRLTTQHRSGLAQALDQYKISTTADHLSHLSSTLTRNEPSNLSEPGDRHPLSTHSIHHVLLLKPASWLPWPMRPSWRKVCGMQSTYLSHSSPSLTYSILTNPFFRCTISATDLATTDPFAHCSRNPPTSGQGC